MAIKFAKEDAENVLRTAAHAAAAEYSDSWDDKIKQLSELCDEGKASTHIAFLGTLILAKSLDLAVDLRAIKPKLSPENDCAFSARSLAHGTLVPLSAELGVHLGVSGREPLNNQPYFRMRVLGDETPVHAGSRAAFDYMVSLVDELAEIGSKEEAERALRAFIRVRRTYMPQYSVADAHVGLPYHELASAIDQLVSAASEGGKRAQAAAAGVLDAFAGHERVDCGRINDPSRHYPGDVCVWKTVERVTVEKAFEVRDKPVTESDVFIFSRRCVHEKLRDAAVLAVSSKQQKLEIDKLHAWGDENGIAITVYYGWSEFVEGALFWSNASTPDAAAKVAERISARLIESEATPDAVDLWHRLTSEN